MPVEAVAAELAPFVEAFEKRPRLGDHSLLQEAESWRRQRFERFLELGLPTSRDEDWKFTNLAPLLGTPFENPDPGDAEAAAAILDKLPKADIVFLNGARLATVAPAVPSGVMFARAGTPFGAIATADADDARRPFVALNGAFLSGAALVHVTRRAHLDRPIHVAHISLPGERRHMTHPRNVFIFEDGVQGTVVETYIGTRVYLTNSVTQIYAGRNTVIDHVKIQQESNDAFHISTIQVQQSRDSVFTSRSFAFGGALARTEILATLEEGSECTLNGLYLVDGKRHIDTRTTIDHAKPHATSHELYKGILDGHSSAVFNGKIIVRKDAQKTDAKQTNKNLVLSEDATINTKPQLEIFADDVRCTHGATVGQLDAESIFYLRSRGIGLEEARRILIEAFAREIIDGVKIAELREYLGRFL